MITLFIPDLLSAVTRAGCPDTNLFSVKTRARYVK